MVAIAVDDEQLMLDALTGCIRAAAPELELYAFQRPAEAMAFAQDRLIDVAFLDIRMRGMDGIELGRRLMEQNPELNIVYCTGYDEYISEAFRSVRCNGYITKPVDAEQIARELAHLRVPMPTAKAKLSFRCMWRFEVFADGLPVQFESGKTKELLACLVDACGGICGNQELIVTLWEDDNRHDSYFKKIRKDLVDTLERYGCGELLIRQRGGLGIRTRLADCDYYRWKEAHPGERPAEYMTQYDWANLPEYEW